MNSATHVGKSGRTRKQPARVCCGTNEISSETGEDEGVMEISRVKQDAFVSFW
jgi:hypothetical protein